MGERIRLGISSCLLGNRVRYDGGHRLDRFLIDALEAFAKFVPVCPEVEAGLGIPRETMRLVGDPARPRLVTTRTRIDHTALMEEWTSRRVRALEAEDLCGFVFKSKSPSSGMARVKVYDEAGLADEVGVGIFARAFMEHFPLIPVEEDGRLHDAALLADFIERIFGYHRSRCGCGG